MLRRLTLLVCLVGAITIPASGQQFVMASDDKLRQDIDTVLTNWRDALNRGDAKTAGSFFVPNAPAINPSGMARAGGQDYVNRIEFQHQQNFQTTAKIDQVQMIGRDAAYAVGPWISTFGANGASQARGMWLQVYERPGNRLEDQRVKFYANRTAINSNRTSMI